MSSFAIVAYLWRDNSGILESYAKRHPGVTILSPGAYFDAAAATRIEAAGGRLMALEQLLSKADLDKVKMESEALRGRAKQELGAQSWQQHCGQHDWDGGRLAPLIEQRVEAEAHNFVMLLEALARAASGFEIGLAMVVEDLMPIGRTIVEWARGRGVPSLVLSHSLILFKPYTIHDRVHADVMAVYGERALEGYRDLGIGEQRFRVIGNPAWDAYAAMKPRKARIRWEVITKYGLNEGRPIVVFGTTWAANLSALGDEKVYRRTLAAFFHACAELRESGLDVQPVIKDRIQNSAFGDSLVPEIAKRHGFAGGSYVYAVEGVEQLIVAADVVVSVDSNMSIEAMLVQTPAVNLISEFGMHLGPCFGAETGVVESEENDLAGWLRKLLTDGGFRQRQCEAMQARAEYYNRGTDGLATQRALELIEELTLPVAGQKEKQYIWQTLLNVSDSDTNQYHNWCRSDLVGLFRHPPRVVLDIGCGAAATGAYIKEHHPAARVVGIEVNQGAAAVAASRIDQVLVGKFEDIDLEASGIRKGSIDTVIVADVLEHMYDPWGTMAGLTPYLTADAQVVASIPNTRNLVLMSDMANGYWTYDSWGLLDITHIRFFTLREIRRFFHETGYRIAHLHHNMDGRLNDFYQRNKDKALVDVDMGRLVIKQVSKEELVELCTWQFYVVAEAGRLTEEAYLDDEKRRSSEAETKPAYQLWQEYRELDEATAELINRRVEQWGAAPRLHLAIVCHPLDPARLAGTLQSLTGQEYQNLAVTIVADAPPPANWNDSDTLSWRWAQEGNILADVNRALLERPSDWVGMVDAGDRLAENALVLLVERILADSAWHVVYTDEDLLLDDGERETPHFKPDFNLDLLRSFPYIGGLLLSRQETFRLVGGFAPDCLGAEETDLVLRAYEALGEKSVGHFADVIYHRRRDGGHCRKPVAELVETGRKMVQGHLARMGIAATVEPGMAPVSYRVRYQHGTAPLVSILIAVRDQAEELQRLMETLLSTTDYPNYEILLLDNASRTDAAVAFLQGIEAIGDPRLGVLRWQDPAALSALHNELARHARGEFLVFLHHDAAVLQADWLDGLLGHAQRAEVGVVTPRLLRPDGTVRQGGLVLGVGGSVGKVFANQSLDDPGYFGRAHLEQDFSALPGGCFVTRRALFQELGGFAADRFPGALAEADYCMRLGQKGYRMVWTPHVSLLCEGTAENLPWCEGSGDHGAGEDEFLRCWLGKTARDPAYNRNLSLLESATFTLETRRPLAWDPLPWHPLPRVLAQPADLVGCGEYRILAPMRALTAAGKLQGWADFHVFTEPELERLDLDAIILQRQAEPPLVEAIARHRKFSRALLVYELDDLITQVPLKSIHRSHVPKDVGAMLRKGVALCDRFVVSTAPLAEAYRDFHDDIRVVPNFIERARWLGLWPLRRQSAKPRVGWAGGIGHTGDLEVIADVVKALSEEVDWVFLGMCPEILLPHVKEFHHGVPIDQYPAKLASLNLDLALAPLEHHPFNEAKSHLRLLEYGVLGYPVVCTDIYPYQGEFPVTRVKNRYSDWVEAIRERIADLDACAREGDALRNYVLDNWMLEDNLDVWLKGWLP